MEGNCYDCSTCRYRYIHFPNMDDFEISMQECLCDGEYYEEEQEERRWRTCLHQGTRQC